MSKMTRLGWMLNKIGSRPTCSETLDKTILKTKTEDKVDLKLKKIVLINRKSTKKERKQLMRERKTLQMFVATSNSIA